MIDNLGIAATPEALREQVRIWLQALSSMRVLGEENYRVEWQRVERAYDYLRLLDLDGAPAEPAKPDRELAIADVIAALQLVEAFLDALGSHPQTQEVTCEVPKEFREGEKPDGAPLIPTYLDASTDWMLSSSYITRHYSDDGTKTLKRRHRIGRTYAYAFSELAALRLKKTQREDAEK